MRKLQEFEMFKRLILDTHQEKIFSSLPKPNLANLDLVEDSDSKPRTERKTSWKMTAAIEDLEEEEDTNPSNEINLAYEGLKKRENKEKLDKKLLQAFEEMVLRSRTNSKQGSKRNSILKLKRSQTAGKSPFVKGLGADNENNDILGLGKKKEKRKVSWKRESSKTTNYKKKKG